MSYTVFFSWQSDTRAQFDNQRFIRECLDSAIQSLPSFCPVVEAPRVEAGTEGLSGTPEVAAAIFDKIDECSFFVADVTLVSRGEFSDLRKSPNTNVSLELGYAAATLGWDRVICVMNKAFGKPEELPFDYRNRRFPISFSSAASKLDRCSLVKTLNFALKVAEEGELRKVSRAIKRLDTSSLKLIYSFGRLHLFNDFGDRGDAAGMEYKDAFARGIPRLLDLGLIVLDVDGAQSKYAYHWTYLGKKVIQQLNFPVTNLNDYVN